MESASSSSEEEEKQAEPEAEAKEEEAPKATAKVNIIIPDNATEVKVKKIEVSCLPEAQEYLRDNFGISTSAVTSKAKAQDYAKQYGIQFHFVKL